MTTIPFTTAHGKYLAIEVPNADVYILDYRIHDDTMMNHLAWGIGKYVVIPDGYYKIIDYAKDITEEQSLEIVGDHNGLFEYPDYTNNELCWCDTALESFKSLLKANGIDDNKNYIILKQK